eukprot:1158565-Pelagomonas_calceolata.AAC.8
MNNVLGKRNLELVATGSKGVGEAFNYAPDHEGTGCCLHPQASSILATTCLGRQALHVPASDDAELALKKLQQVLSLPESTREERHENHARGCVSSRGCYLSQNGNVVMQFPAQTLLPGWIALAPARLSCLCTPNRLEMKVLPALNCTPKIGAGRGTPAGQSTLLFLHETGKTGSKVVEGGQFCPHSQPWDPHAFLTSFYLTHIIYSSLHNPIPECRRHGFLKNTLTGQHFQ